MHIYFLHDNMVCFPKSSYVTVCKLDERKPNPGGYINHVYLPLSRDTSECTPVYPVYTFRKIVYVTTILQSKSKVLDWNYVVDCGFCLLELVFLDIWIHLIVPVATPPQSKCLIIIILVSP